MINWNEQLRLALVYSYAYYILDDILVPDDMYDQMMRDLLNNWDKVDSEWKHLVDEDSLRAGSMSHLRRGMYPEEVREEAERKVG